MFRFAEPSDAAAIQAIYAPFVENTVTSFEMEVPTVEEMADRVERLKPLYPWIVLSDPTVQGYAYASPHRSRHAYQWSVEVSVYLAPSHRGRGLGSALYTKLFEILRAQGFANAFAGISLPNEASQKLHRKLGFEEVGTYRKVGFKFDAWHDVQWYGMRLQEVVASPRPFQATDLNP